MNIDPVLIEDDDVDMEPVVILDEDDENIINEKVVGVQTVETIVLDDESAIITEGTVKNNIIIKPITTNKSETSFVNNLKNNRLMDKIVKRCLNMENATGMPRVLYKTLLPLYRDTNNTFKESESFRALLKKTYKLLMRDPDHKFLHIKTLCEELKSGGLRRKVPFVTLANNLKNRCQWDHQELTSSSREINQNKEENRQTHEVSTNKNNKRKKVGGTGTKRKAKISKSRAVNTKDRIKTRNAARAEKKKADIIELDDSDNESVDRAQNDDGECCVIIIEETEPIDQRNDNVNTVVQETVKAESKETNEVVEETLEAESKKGNQVVQETLEANCNIENKVVEETIEEDSNKENNADNGKSSDNEMDYELLIPKNHVEVLPIENEVPHNSTSDIERIARLEQQIVNYKQKIDKLEETEVTAESPSGSPYYLCSKYKENVVACYKQICEIKGNCKDLVKRREIRLIVAEGHPPGPAKRLEEFLNCTIDRTGAVEFPDFSDVVKCVVESNFTDNLAWNRQQVMQEAIALFRQCGQALRKRRQKREYRDLLSLIRDNAETEDPAEKDPILQAKLEENKLIAKIKEEEILERYVRMENNALPRVGVPQVGNAVEFESDQDSSGSDSDTESEYIINLPNIPTSTINNQPDIGECSRSTISLSLLRTNNIIFASTFRNNHFDTGLSSKTNDENHFEVNSMLLNGNNMRYVENTEITAANEPCNVNDVQNQVSSTTDGIEQNCDSSISTEGAKVKSKDNVKREPLDIQNMLDELGDSFVCQVFDIEDPFLVIEISSDGFTDDDL